ncbi:MAG: CalY family protein [Candidatus Roizmanbacteria bacterium]|nr:CalY family protein [Candidatus Roizmanbacteria bacterium]
MNTRTRILISVLVLATLGAGTYAATQAFFSARRTTTENRFQTGTLDLNVAENGGQAADPFVIDNAGADGEISGSKTWTVKNTGSLPGRLFLRLQNVDNKENGCNDPEIEAEPDCASTTQGELGNVITLNVALDGVNAVSSTLATNQQAAIGTAWNGLTPIILQPNQTVEVGLNWAAGADDYGNEVQSDSVTFDADFRLIQVTNNGPTPTN